MAGLQFITTFSFYSVSFIDYFKLAYKGFYHGVYVPVCAGEAREQHPVSSFITLHFVFGDRVSH